MTGLRKSDSNRMQSYTDKYRKSENSYKLKHPATPERRSHTHV